MHTYAARRHRNLSLLRSGDIATTSTLRWQRAAGNQQTPGYLIGGAASATPHSWRAPCTLPARGADGGACPAAAVAVSDGRREVFRLPARRVVRGGREQLGAGCAVVVQVDELLGLSDQRTASTPASPEQRSRVAARPARGILIGNHDDAHDL